MGYIHCCGRLIKATCFILSAPVGFVESRLLVVDSCPHCNSYITVLVRVNHLSHTEAIRKSNLKARTFFEKLKSSILFKEELPAFTNIPASKSYLNYSHFGKTKKCYSNLSTLSCGQQDPLSHLDFVDKIKHKGFIAL